MKVSLQAESIVSEMSLEEKTSFCSGGSFWHTKELARLGLFRQMMADGPHGLRKQVEDPRKSGSFCSVEATCFPTAALTACSFEPELLEKMGEAIGDKCIRENVSLLLGPGVNIKRSPMGGRNFDYFSEDPYLTSEMAIGMINGVQKKGIGTTVKHFAANSQEYARLINDSIMDERTLFEIYLTAFERIIKKASPWSIMCSYNRVNGVYTSESYWLLTQIVRERWGFEGTVISDWGATVDAAISVMAGMDLEMPYSGSENTNRIIDAVKCGDLTERQLDKVVQRIVELVLKAQSNEHKSDHTDEEDHKLAQEMTEKSAVLLKNDGILPLSNQRIAFIGQLAATPRIQGEGSSKVNAIRVDNAYEEAIKAGFKIEYAPGYRIDSDEVDITLLEEAMQLADNVETVVMFVGVVNEVEKDGYDRKDFGLPANQLKVLEEVRKINSNVVVVLQCGAPVDMSWAEKIKSVLLVYYGGEASGAATVNLLWGRVNPSGRLAETWPVNIEDTPAYGHYAKERAFSDYRESIYVGYRFYDTLKVPVSFPFGHGLSYTTFKYNNLTVRELGNNHFEVNVDVTNTGRRAGAETVQVYVGFKDSKIFRASKELKGFKKVYLEPQETKTVKVMLDKDSFRYHNPVRHKMSIETGEYQVMIGRNVSDIVLTEKVKISGDGDETALIPGTRDIPTYMSPKFPFVVSEREFTRLLGYRPCYHDDIKRMYDVHSCMVDIKDTFVGRRLYKHLDHYINETMGSDADINSKKALKEVLVNMPIRSMSMSGRYTHRQLDGIVDMANHHFISGLKKYKTK